jgi:hypothetical protein
MVPASPTRAATRFSSSRPAWRCSPWRWRTSPRPWSWWRRSRRRRTGCIASSRTSAATRPQSRWNGAFITWPRCGGRSGSSSATARPAVGRAARAD